jgi:hypothetical protein
MWLRSGARQASHHLYQRCRGGARAGDVTMTTPDTNPWQQDERAAHRSATDPLYDALMQTLRNCARANADLPAANAIMAAMDLAGDLAVSSGVLWTSPDIIESLQALTRTLERRRDNGPMPKHVHATLMAWFASVRPPVAH